MAIICQILGYDHERVVDEAILGFLSLIFSLTSMVLPKIDYCQLTKKFIQVQMEKFYSTMSLRYQFYLVYLILSQNHPYYDYWEMNINKESGGMNPINAWN